MVKNISNRYDTEKSWLVFHAEYDKMDIPFIRTATGIPTSLQRFSGSKNPSEFSSWVHFYEPDYKFTQLWNNPQQYVSRLKKFEGIISPDFSICPDSPWPVQFYNKYRNHALAYWLSLQGVPVIPNVRWGNESSFEFCFRGIEKNSTVAIGTLGQLKKSGNRDLFLAGLPVMVATLSPHTIIVYGKAPNDIFGRYSASGINIIHFPSATERYHNCGRGVA